MLLYGPDGRALAAETLKYRPDIDGLRAVAVLPVILCHAGYAGFTGGFVGVDVFFVISGYLISGIILEDMAAGRFSLADFYERRIRRILPMLLTVVILSAAVGYVLMLPYQLEDLSRSARADGLVQERRAALRFVRVEQTIDCPALIGLNKKGTCLEAGHR